MTSLPLALPVQAPDRTSPGRCSSRLRVLLLAGWLGYSGAALAWFYVNDPLMTGICRVLR